MVKKMKETIFSIFSSKFIGHKTGQAHNLMPDPTLHAQPVFRPICVLYFDQHFGAAHSSRHMLFHIYHPKGPLGLDKHSSILKVSLV